MPVTNNDAVKRSYLAAYTGADPRPGAYLQGYCQPVTKMLPKETFTQRPQNKKA